MSQKGKQEPENIFKNILNKLDFDIQTPKKANNNQGKKIKDVKEGMENMFNPLPNHFNSIVENINYTECINGKCSSVDMNNIGSSFNEAMSNTKGNNINTRMNVDRYTTSKILKDNINNLVYMIYIIVIIFCFVEILFNKKQIYLISIIVATLLLVFYKIFMR